MTYHERLRRRQRSAAELERDKRRMNQGPTLSEIERRLQETEQQALDVSNYAGYPDAEVPVDDGEPPAAPQNVVVTPFFHQLDVSWSEPPYDDHVARAFVRVREVDAPANERVVEVAPYGGSVMDLPAEPHTVEVQLEDRWGRRSGWSAAVEATPLLTAAEQVDLGELAMLGRLQGLLPNANLATLEDATKLGEQVVLARAMAAQDAAAFNLWAQDAMIRSAAIISLAVDKLTAGTFTAGAMVLAGGGRLKAGQVYLDATGMAMPPSFGYDSPGDEADYKITSSGRWAAMHFYDDGINRGTAMVSRGSSSRDARMVVAVSHPGSTADALLLMRANANGNASTLLQAQGDLYLEGKSVRLEIGGRIYRVTIDANGFLKGV